MLAGLLACLMDELASWADCYSLFVLPHVISYNEVGWNCDTKGNASFCRAAEWELQLNNLSGWNVSLTISAFERRELLWSIRIRSTKNIYTHTGKALNTHMIIHKNESFHHIISKRSLRPISLKFGFFESSFWPSILRQGGKCYQRFQYPDSKHFLHLQNEMKDVRIVSYLFCGCDIFGDSRSSWRDEFLICLLINDQCLTLNLPSVLELDFFLRVRNFAPNLTGWAAAAGSCRSCRRSSWGCCCCCWMFWWRTRLSAGLMGL